MKVISEFQCESGGLVNYYNIVILYLDYCVPIK